MKALARAFRYQKILDEGRYGSITEMAAAERIERGYPGSLLRLTLLAPAIVKAILDGSETDGISLPRVMEPLPISWSERRVLLGHIRHAEEPDHRATERHYRMTASTR